MSCPVCLCECECDGAEATTTACGHLFHRACLQGWAERGRTTCPVCRTELGFLQRRRRVFVVELGGFLHFETVIQRWLELGFERRLVRGSREQNVVMTRKQAAVVVSAPCATPGRGRHRLVVPFGALDGLARYRRCLLFRFYREGRLCLLCVECETCAAAAGCFETAMVLVLDSDTPLRRLLTEGHLVGAEA